MMVNRTTGRLALSIQRYVLAFLLIGALFTGSACVETGPPIENLRESTVRIVCLAKLNGKRVEDPLPIGSGFIVGDGRHVVTNQHVLKQCEVLNKPDEVEKTVAQTLREFQEKGGVWKIGILLGAEQEGEKEQEPVEARAPLPLPDWKDFAILEFARPLKIPPVTFARSEAKVGQTVYALGFPSAAQEGMHGSMTVTSGIISNLAISDKEGVHHYQVSAPLNPGNSGGPLVDANGYVLGVTTLKSLVTVAAVEKGKVVAKRVPLGEGIGWAIRASELLPELRKLQIEPQIASLYQANPIGRLWRQYPIIFPLSAGAFFLSSLALTFVFVRRQDTPKGVSQAPVEVKRRPFLSSIAGHLKGQAFPVEGASLTLGRDPKESQIIFPPNMTAIGRAHCVIRYDKATGVLILEDCGSRNGTFLSTGEKLRAGEPRRLRPGDKFYLSDPATMFEVRWE